MRRWRRGRFWIVWISCLNVRRGFFALRATTVAPVDWAMPYSPPGVGCGGGEAGGGTGFGGLAGGAGATAGLAGAGGAGLRRGAPPTRNPAPLTSYPHLRGTSIP